MGRMAAIITCMVGLVLIVGPGVGSTKAGKPCVIAQESSGSKAGSPPEAAQGGPQAAAPSYADVAGIIAKYNCTVCHGAIEPRDGLSLDTYKGMMKGGKDGPVIKPGDPDKSELVRRIKGTKEPRMPFTGPPWLSEAEIDTVVRWIKAGAPEGKK
jgi:mono/diheme cytochrome c family protein